MRSLLAASVLLFVGSQNQEGLSPEVKILQASSSRTLGVSDIVAEYARCDGNGHVFYQIAPAGSALNDSVVMKLDLKSETPMIYAQPAEYRGNVFFLDYSLTPSGRLWYLDKVADKTGFLAVGFDSDGRAMTQTHLDTPEHLEASRFAVSDDGSILVGGFFSAEAKSELRGKSYLGIFGRSGALIKDAGAEFPAQDLEAFAKGTWLNAPVTAGADGNFYVLDNESVFVMSEAGEIIRRMKFRKPEGKVHVHAMALSEGLLSIEFLIPASDGRSTPEFVVIQSTTGAPYAMYKPSEEVGSVCLCFSRQDGYTFSRWDNGKIKIVMAALR